jgi:superfamily II DNA or RNA helicase
LKRKEHKRVLLENRKWDLIIFDEAHRLSAKEYGRKTDKTQNDQLAEVLRDYTDALLLLTATPHAGDRGLYHAYIKSRADSLNTF